MGTREKNNSIDSNADNCHTKQTVVKNETRPSRIRRRKTNTAQQNKLAN